MLTIFHVLENFWLSRHFKANGEPVHGWWHSTESDRNLMALRCACSLIMPSRTKGVEVIARAV